MECLANKLQGMITSQLSKKNLRNLRLTSKSYAHIGAEHLFCTFYFASSQRSLVRQSELLRHGGLHQHIRALVHDENHDDEAWPIAERHEPNVTVFKDIVRNFLAAKCKIVELEYRLTEHVTHLSRHVSFLAGEVLLRSAHAAHYRQ